MSLITVMTPTYNRAYILSKLYESLIMQTSYDFEWIIIDDNSSDDTEMLVRSFNTDKFAIRYFKQPHGGKHRAINFAVREAKGKYFFIVDSDDYLLPDAIENIASWLLDTEKSNDSVVCGVAGLRVSPLGEVIGGDVITNDSFVVASNLEREKYNLLGDKAEIYSLDILKKYPFPEFENEFFVTEACVWDKIAYDGYKLRWYNKPIYVCEYLEDGLTKTGANDYSGHMNNILGYSYYVSIIFLTRKKDEVIRNYLLYKEICAKKGIKPFKQLVSLNVPIYKCALVEMESILYRIWQKIRRMTK